MYKKEDLGRELFITQKDDGFKFGTDSVLLAKFLLMNKELIPAKGNIRVADFGCSSGILPLLLSREESITKITGIEIQEEYANLAKKNVEDNNLSARVEILKGDICKAGEILGNATQDAVITNPPYKKSGKGITSENKSEQIARHEILCTLEDVVREAGNVLKTRGAFYMINRAERLADAIELCRKYKIEPKKIRIVQTKQDKAPSLFLIAGVKNGGANLVVEKPLIMLDNEGKETLELREIYEY